MGKAVKKVATVGAKLNPVYWANKGIVDAMRGRDPLKAASADANSTLGINGQGVDESGNYAGLDALLAGSAAQGGTDRATIDAYGAGEYDKANKTNADILEMRKARRGELAALLTKQADQEFQLSKPELAEEANSAGILYSTGYGDRLAERKLELARQRENTLAQDALGDVNADIEGKLSAETLRRGYGDSGMSRKFGLEDFAREGRVAKEIGATSAPSVGGGKGGLLAAGAAGASAGSAFGPWGAAIGGGAGAILGNSANKKGK